MSLKSDQLEILLSVYMSLTEGKLCPPIPEL